MFKAYLALTKPRISLLFAFTAFAVFWMAGLSGSPFRFTLLVAAVFMVGGAANALNQYFDRDRDRRMERTAKKRPIPQGLVSPNAAVVFSAILGSTGILILWIWGNLFAASLGLFTILFYSFFYTLYLKPRTPYNIVIGGIAGSMGPLIASAAVDATLSLFAFLLFLLVFFWTPPHFWALALCCKDDYAKVGIPMLPLVAGDEATRKQILAYSIVLFPLSLSLALFESVGFVYLVSAILLNGLFVWGALRVYREKTLKTYWQFFGYSIVYLLMLFTMLVVDQMTA